MDAEEIKKLRASFTNPYREDLPKTHKNQFGHTILGNERDVDTSLVSPKIDENGVVIAEPNVFIADSPQLQEWAENHAVFGHPESDEQEFDLPKIEKVSILANKSIADLISELDEMDGTSKNPEIQKPVIRKQSNNSFDASSDNSKSCSNKDCVCRLPKEAKFCMNCGSAQMPKFCTECGYSFPGMEKFCPDCGNKR